MNFRLFLPILAANLLLGLSVVPLHAQSDNGAATGGAGGGSRLSFLTREEKIHLYKVRKAVLDSNPDLKAERDSLTKEREFVKNECANATADDKKTLFQNFMAHTQKMDAAMRQQDPSIGPVLDQINAKVQERIQEKTGGASAGDAAAN
jgi:hypothetical protein